MKNDLPRYTLRISQELLNKIGYIADYEGRTKNKEIEQLIKKRIQEFEKRFLEFVKTQYADILEAIRETKQMSDVARKMISERFDQRDVWAATVEMYKQL